MCYFLVYYKLSANLDNALIIKSLEIITGVLHIEPVIYRKRTYNIFVQNIANLETMIYIRNI